MVLVDYSDSDEEEAPADKLAPKTTNSSFKKVVDRSNPGKIKVSLPEPVQSTNGNDEHPAKRVKTAGGGFSDFKSFLPPPKQRGQTSIGGSGGTKKTGIAPGVSLKTGATPGFNRAAEDSTEFLETSNGEFHDENMAGYGGREPNLPTSKGPKNDIQNPPEEAKLVGKPLMFKPLSVARKPSKKKSPGGVSINTSPSIAAASTTVASRKLEEIPRKSAVSLFTIAADSDAPIDSTSSGEYQPVIHGTGNYKFMSEEPSTTTAYPSYEGYGEPAQPDLSPPVASLQGAQSLNDIASDLNLSTAERRQLFGRQKGSKNGDMLSATKIINFNTDEEYRHNEELRAAGEIAVHKPVRAIAPGKHNLKQLVNAAQNQKEALEESFAQGKANRAEAGSRYGWGGSR